MPSTRYHSLTHPLLWGENPITFMCYRTLVLVGPLVPPAVKSNHRPDRLHQSEGPSALQEAVDRGQCARECKKQDEPVAPFFKSIKQQHGAYRKQPEQRKPIHHKKRTSQREQENASRAAKRRERSAGFPRFDIMAVLLIRQLSPNSARFLVFVLPALLLISSPFLMAAHGPFYLNGNLDPDYAYLFNSLLLLNGHPPSHIDHPGTTVQSLGALVIFLRSVLTAASSNIPEMTISVLKEPESALVAIHRVILLLLSVALAWVGWKMAARKGIAFAILFQTLSLGFATVIRALTRVSPEPFLFAASLLVMLMLQLELDAGSRRWHIPVALGMLLGFGIATKITFVPLCLTILILQGAPRKWIACLSLCISTFLFTLPLRARYGDFAEWVGRLATHSDRFGAGPVGLPGTARIWDGTVQMVGQEPFLLLLILELAVLLIVRIRKGKKASELLRQNDRAFVVGTLILLVQSAASLKHPGVHYLLPVMILAAWLQTRLLQNLRERNNGWKGFALGAVVATVILAGIPAVVGTVAWIGDMRANQANMGELAKAASARKCGLISYYSSSVPAFSISFGNGLSSNVFAKELFVLYPDQIFFDVWRHQFYNYAGSLTNADALSSAHCVLMQGTPILTKEDFVLKPLLERGSEVLYEARLPDDSGLNRP